MNRRQLIAYRNPCARAEDTLDPKFCRMLSVEGVWVSTIVTLNKCLDFNDGRPVWHASVAVAGSRDHGPVLTHLLSRAMLSLEIRLAKALIEGVGQAPWSVEAHPITVQCRRSLTDVELAGLPEAWCAIPAVHQGGTGVLLERSP